MMNSFKVNEKTGGGLRERIGVTDILQIPCQGDVSA
jgi:hypothetical protein